MYNESEIIAGTATVLSKYMTELHFTDYEIIFCDDGSTDNSSKILSELALPNIKVIGYADNRGKGCAVRHAMLSATGDIRIFTDSDLAYGVDVIKTIINIFENDENIDYVIGSRRLHPEGYDNYTLIRKICSKVFLLAAKIIGGFNVSDSQCGCKAYRRVAAERIFKNCTVDGFAFDFETIILAKKFGMKIVPFPVKIINHRESKVHLLKDSFSMLFDLFRIRIRTAFKRCV